MSTPSPRLAALALALIAAPVAAACGGDDGPPAGVAAECNPLGEVGCATPWPSSLYLRDDATSPTGVRMDLPLGGMPANVDGIDLDPAPFARRTGFSPAAQIVTAFAGGVDDANLVGFDDMAASLTDASPTVLLDMDTGERVAHFAEVDANAVAEADWDHQALYLRPAARLIGGHRYAVGIRKSLLGRGGGALPVPAGFQAILDGTPSGHARLEANRAKLEEAIAALEDAGVPRTDLVVAWDFVTADDDSVLADTRAARDAALAAMGTDAANVTYAIDVDQDPYPDDPGIARRVIFHYDVPQVADDDGLIRDGDGTPIAMGTSAATAVAMIPTCATAANHAGIIIFGHGFFGDTSEAEGSYMRRVARDLCMIVVGGVWRGMSTDDLAFAFGALNDSNQAARFGERIVQGIVDFIALEQLARTKLATEVFIDDNDAAIVDADRTYFYGISQGAILGTTFFAWDPHLTRGVFHVGGGNWGVLFERSTNWVTFNLGLSGAYPSPLDRVLVQQVMQMGFDDTDPVHVAPHTVTDPLPGVSPDKQYLLQMSVGDAQVTNLATHLLARTEGLSVLGPALYVPYGLDEVDGPQADALVMFTEDPSPLPPTSNLLNMTGNEAHGELRKREAVVEQIRGFYATGEIVHTCGDGVVCDCSMGACGPKDPP
ncbi:MAG: hypothetical protein KC464_24485 [Myxococcales bacterium]|nr:hypothetical protein [Myxococcales bacterium]